MPPMKRVIAEERPLLIGYDESRFTAALAYHQDDLEEELDPLEGMRRQMARILRGLPEAAWSRTGVHNERGLITLEEMLQAEVEHVPHHIAYIVEKRVALGFVKRRNSTSLTGSWGGAGHEHDFADSVGRGRGVHGPVLHVVSGPGGRRRLALDRLPAPDSKDAARRVD